MVLYCWSRREDYKTLPSIGMLSCMCVVCVDAVYLLVQTGSIPWSATVFQCDRCLMFYPAGVRRGVIVGLSLCFSSILFFSIIGLAVCWKGVVDEKRREKVCVCLFIYLFIWGALLTVTVIILCKAWQQRQ